MSGTTAVINALKTLLRQAGVTYAQAGEALDLSEASVKRLFAQEGFTLKRLETLAQLAGAELTDLVRQADDKAQELERLPLSVEEELAGNPALLLSAICVLNRYRFEEILALYAIDEHELQQHFARLDRLKLIELLANNRYRARLSRGFAWLPGGPIESYFVKSIFSGFFDKRLIRDKNQFRFAWGTVTQETAQRFLERLRVVYQEFNEAADRDSKLPIESRSGSALVLAFRTDWEPEEFSRIRRQG